MPQYDHDGPDGPEDVEYESVEPFDIDHGELDGIRPQLVFTMGVEWEMLRQELDAGREVSRMIHVENAKRIEQMCRRRGREWIMGICTDGEWMSLHVAAM